MRERVPPEGNRVKEGMNMEVEVKARLEDLEGIKKKLVAMGVVFNGSVTQKDKYFRKKGFEKRPQGPGDFIARIRVAEGETTICTKTLTDVLGAWIENETEIKSPEEMEKILLTFGFINVFNVNKSRESGSFRDFEVLLDDVKELGKFIEVSLISEEKEKTRERIISFLRELGIPEDRIEKRGYGELISEDMGCKFGGMR